MGVLDIILAPFVLGPDNPLLKCNVRPSLILKLKPFKRMNVAVLLRVRCEQGSSSRHVILLYLLFTDFYFSRLFIWESKAVLVIGSSEVRLSFVDFLARLPGRCFARSSRRRHL